MQAIPRAAVPSWLGPVVLFAACIFFVLVVLYGRFIADPEIVVRQFDAGPIEEFAIGQVNAFPERHLYLVGLENGQVRAVDGRVESSGCTVEYRPDDERGVPKNPLGVTGAYVDPCTGAVWSIAGDGISGAEEPLRTPEVSYRPGADGSLHVWVELVNPPEVEETPTQGPA